MIDHYQGGASAHPALTGAGLVAGIGLRAEVSAEELFGLLDACLATIKAERSDLVALATLDTKADHPALRTMAARLSLPLVAMSKASLAGQVPNPSRRVADLVEIASVAEAAALAFGPLLVEKRRSAGATCALSRYEASSARDRASNASSTLATSSAGP